MEDNKNLPSTRKVENRAELETIRRRFDIDEVRFEKGVMFVSAYLDHGNKTRAYQEITGCDKQTARQSAGSLFRGKWIQELLRFMQPDERTLYVGEIKDIIEAGMEIIRDRGASNRDKSEAMKALQPYIKQAKLDVDVDVEIKASVGESIASKISNQVKALAASGKMINEDGDIIDVEPIE